MRVLFCSLIQCYEFHSVPPGINGISCIGIQSRTKMPFVPPRVKIRPVSGYFGRSGVFWQIPAKTKDSTGMCFGFASHFTVHRDRRRRQKNKTKQKKTKQKKIQVMDKA